MFDDLVKKKFKLPFPPKQTVKKSESQKMYEDWMKKRLGLRGVKYYV